MEFESKLVPIMREGVDIIKMVPSHFKWVTIFNRVIPHTD